MMAFKGCLQNAQVVSTGHNIFVPDNTAPSSYTRAAKRQTFFTLAPSGIGHFRKLKSNTEFWYRYDMPTEDKSKLKSNRDSDRYMPGDYGSHTVQIRKRASRCAGVSENTAHNMRS